MTRVKYDGKGSIVDAETGTQLLQLIDVNCSKKFRNMAAKELVNKLNTIAQGQSARKQAAQ